MPDAAHQRGFALLTLLVALAVMMVLMSAGLPAWRYVLKNEKEEELLFRGGQIADAIESFQKKNGNAAPPSLEALVKGRYLRKAYADPMSVDGRWRFLRPGEGVAFGSQVAVPQLGLPSPAPQADEGSRRPRGAAPAPVPTGPLAGVVSRSGERSLRVFNGRGRYDEWYFVPGQPRIVGRSPDAPAAAGSPAAAPNPAAPPEPVRTRD